MSKFFFDILDAHGVCSDPEGSECSPGSIRDMALESLYEVAADIRTRPNMDSTTIRVRDAAGVCVYKATLRLNESIIPSSVP